MSSKLSYQSSIMDISIFGNNICFSIILPSIAVIKKKSSNSNNLQKSNNNIFLVTKYKD